MPEVFEYTTAPDPNKLGPGPTPEPSRRGFLFWLGAGINAVAAVLIAIPVVGYLLGPWKSGGSQKWVSLGKVVDFPQDQTRLGEYRNPFTTPWDGYVANTPCWVRRQKGETFSVFAINCTHLGCPVRWFPESSLFMCPCHGGVYYADGEHAAGPPPRGLYTYETRIKDGNLEIKAGRLPSLQQTP